MWQNFLVVITEKTIRLEFPEVPTPLLKLLRSPEASLIASNNDLWWERPNEEIWLTRLSGLARKYNARIEDLRFVQTETVSPAPNHVLPDLTEVLSELANLRQEVVELKKFDAIAFKKLSELKLQLRKVGAEVPSDPTFSRLESGQQKPKATTQKSSRRNGKTKSSS